MNSFLCIILSFTISLLFSVFISILFSATSILVNFFIGFFSAIGVGLFITPIINNFFQGSEDE